MTPYNGRQLQEHNYILSSVRNLNADNYVNFNFILTIKFKPLY